MPFKTIVTRLYAVFIDRYTNGIGKYKAFIDLNLIFHISFTICIPLIFNWKKIKKIVN